MTNIHMFKYKEDFTIIKYFCDDRIAAVEARYSTKHLPTISTCNQSGTFFLEVEPREDQVEIALINVNGQMVYQDSFTELSKVKIETDLPAGFYLARVKIRGMEQAIKLMIEK